MDSPGTPFKPNILVAPLDWGLGHATRCIPLTRELLKQGANVVLGCEGPVRSLLQAEFPQLPFVHLQGYGVGYSRSRWSLPFTMASQIPKILSAIQYENERSKDIVKDHYINGIISDNRYGLYHPAVPAVFITHQLAIRTGLGAAADRALRSLNYSYIERFSECWVPDAEEAPGLAGNLSHPLILPKIPVRYVGALSRFSAQAPMGDKLLILLSGPEPQRTLLENLVRAQLEDYDSPVTLVRGLPSSDEPLEMPSHVTVYNHLPAQALAEQMARARLVVARCGYSTVMDLAALGKKSILIPTPGQTEQQYLARHLTATRFSLCIEQHKFRLKPALDLANGFDYAVKSFHAQQQLSSTVRSFLEKLPRAVLK